MGRRISTGGRGRDRGERVKERRQELAWGFTSSIEMGQVGKSRGPSGSGTWWFPWDPAPPGASHGIDERLCHLFWGGGGGFSWKEVGNKERRISLLERKTQRVDWMFKAWKKRSAVRSQITVAPSQKTPKQRLH